jgi:hypothetical protein
MSDSARQPDTMDPELLREDAERTREQLGQTVQELADKFDVPGRAKKAARRVQHKARAVGPQPLAGAAIAVALLLAWWTIRRWIR